MTEIAREPAAAGSARYSTLAIVLHWAIAAAIVLQIVLSSRMGGPRTPTSFAVTQLHKSIGITILLLSLVRLGWRLAHKPAPLPTTMARWERELSRAVHVGFYLIMIGMPLTGWITVSASRVELPTLLYGTIPWPNLPLHDLAPAARKAWHTVGETGHGLIAKVIYVLLALHVAGALKHQLLSRDEPVLARMAPGAVPGRWLEPRIAVIALSFLAVIAFGKFVTPPSPGLAPPPAAVTPQPPAPEPAAPPPAASAAPPALAVTPVSIDPVKWTVDPGSAIDFATAWSGTVVQGRFDKWRADILFSPEALDRSKVTVVIDLGSVNTGDKQRDATLPSADWFDAAAHPKAVFTATRFQKTGADRYRARGTLELKGVKKPVDLQFRLIIKGDRAEMGGDAMLDRTAFGIGQGEFAATDQIPAQVSVKVGVKAHRG